MEKRKPNKQLKTKSMKIFGITKKYKSLSWTENFLGGHLNIGKRITIFGDNAMHWVFELRTKKYGVISVRFFTTRPKSHPIRIYFSPNGTPWACTFYYGFGKKAKKESELARKRRAAFGHNFDAWGNEGIKHELRWINNAQ